MAERGWWRCRRRNRGIVARPTSTARRPRPARKRGRHGCRSASGRGSRRVSLPPGPHGLRATCRRRARKPMRMHERVEGSKRSGPERHVRRSGPLCRCRGTRAPRAPPPARTAACRRCSRDRRRRCSSRSHDHRRARRGARRVGRGAVALRGDRRRRCWCRRRVERARRGGAGRVVAGAVGARPRAAGDLVIGALRSGRGRVARSAIVRVAQAKTGSANSVAKVIVSLISFLLARAGGLPPASRRCGRSKRSRDVELRPGLHPRGARTRFQPRRTCRLVAELRQRRRLSSWRPATSSGRGPGMLQPLVRHRDEPRADAEEAAHRDDRHGRWRPCGMMMSSTSPMLSLFSL